MSKPGSWLPRKREDILKMGFAWVDNLTKYSEKWNVDKAVMGDLKILVDDLAAKMKLLDSTATATPDAVQACEKAEKVLVLKMRDVKKRWFIEPPLEDEDYPALRLKKPDHVRTPGKKPTATVEVQTPTARNLKLDIFFNYIDGSPNDPENKLYYLYGVIIGDGEKEPMYPSELPFIGIFVKRKNTLQFAPEDVHCTVFLAAQIVNGRKLGPMGPIASQTIIAANEKGSGKTAPKRENSHEDVPVQKLEPRKIHIAQDND
jgi:hypothetical protein